MGVGVGGLEGAWSLHKANYRKLMSLEELELLVGCSEKGEAWGRKFVEQGYEQEEQRQQGLALVAIWVEWETAEPC